MENVRTKDKHFSINIRCVIYLSIFEFPFVLSNVSGRYGALKSDSTLHFFRNACTKSGSLRFSQFSGCWPIWSVYILMNFDFPLCKIVRSSVILLLPLFMYKLLIFICSVFILPIDYKILTVEAILNTIISYYLKCDFGFWFVGSGIDIQHFMKWHLIREEMVI